MAVDACTERGKARLYIDALEADPKRIPGVVETPMTWAELKECVVSNRVELLGRTEKDLEDYRQYLSDVVKKKFATTGDLILVRDFGLESAAKSDKEGKLYVPPEVYASSDNPESRRVAMKENDFPYHCEAGINHWLLWSNYQMDEEEAHARFAEKFPIEEFDRIIFVNPVARQSVRELHHWHLFVRPRRNSKMCDEKGKC